MNNPRPLFFFYFTIIILATSCTTTQEETSKFYQNPILRGDYPDPSIVRVGSDFYLTHSSSDYYPGLLIWHSTDLVHWERISHALTTNIGSVWAPDLIYCQGKFYIYFPANGTNWVIAADSPEGPWSEPVDLHLNGFIDPGHVEDAEGNRYLYLSKGYVVKLTSDGLATVGEPVSNYEGWQFPEEWDTECFCLESPKSTVKDGYFYLTVAEGGTAGPPTSHMAVAARAKSPFGPFENSPYNPIIHTKDSLASWWSEGHGTLVDDVAGNWWMIYHAYEKSFHTLGRHTLMLPIEWTADNWFRVPPEIKSSDTIPVPAGKTCAHNSSLSDDFSEAKLSLQWQFFKLYEPERTTIKDGKLIFQASGNNFTNSSPLLVNPGDKKYEISAEITITKNAQAGLCLFYNETANMRIEINENEITIFNREDAETSFTNPIGKHGFMRITNNKNTVSFYYSTNGTNWTKAQPEIDASVFNHNKLGGFLSLRTGIYAFGEGAVTFDNFIYKPF